LTFQLQNEHQQIGCYRVNFKEKAIYMPKNMQIGNLHENAGKNEPLYYKGLRKVLAKIEGLNISEKT
jgi:hypothetical protein